MNQVIIKRRLLEYAKQCLLLGRDLFLLDLPDGKHLAGQLIRSGSHPGIHYGEARAAESRRDFTPKPGVLLKELREAHNTIRLIEMMKYFGAERLLFLLEEGNELVSIFTATVKKLKSNPKG